MRTPHNYYRYKIGQNIFGRFGRQLKYSLQCNWFMCKACKIECENKNNRGMLNRY